MRHPKDPQNGQVLDPSWTLRCGVNHTPLASNSGDLAFQAVTQNRRLRVALVNGEIQVARCPRSPLWRRGLTSLEEWWLTVDQHFTAESLIEEPISTEMSATLQQIARSLLARLSVVIQRAR